MRVLLTSVGSAGDIHPFVAVGLALRARGHEVVFSANPFFQERIESAGLAFEPLGEFLDPGEIARTHPAAFRRFTGARTLFREVFGPLMADLVAGMRRAADRAEPDVMVGHQISFGGPWVARRAGVPWFTTVLAPSTMLSNDDPSVYPLGLDVRGAPMWLRRLQHWAARKTVNGMLDPLLHDLRAGEGLPRRGDTLFGEMLEGRVLGLFSPSFRGPARDDPPGMTICGFPWFDRGEADARLAPELETFLAEGAAPVVIAMGSVLSQTEDVVLRRVVRAVRGAGHRVVLVGRDGREHETHDREMVRVGYAPFGALFPRAAAVVHHGGIGTTAQTLRAGVPALVLAFAHDQFDNAARVERLGVGARGTSRTVERAIADRVDRIVGDAAMGARCRALGERIGSEDGADRAAREITGQ
jgi:UDP:flavonoid glycosyltransferase YjiC (YdhE family)